MAVNKISSGALAALSQASFWAPDYVSQSAWIEHAPFAFWLTEALGPRCFVELGSHYAYSYFAFCQAIDRLRLGTSAYAIDTWQGDEHAGFYDQSVFNSVSTYNKNKYARFSRLVRATFDDALRYFPDRSVDLLHVDGRHFYDDVKHDFNSWQPKLTRDAIVLFHDTNVRERDFGVWKFFGELSVDRPSFEFFHGNGLGILAMGTVPEALAPLFEASDEDANQIRSIYGALGGVIAPRRALEAKTEAIEALLRPGADVTAANAETYARLSDWDDQIQKVRGILESQLSSVDDLRTIVQDRDRQINSITHQATELKTRIQDRDRKIAVLTHRARELEAGVHEQTRRLSEVEQTIEALRFELVHQTSVADAMAQQLHLVHNSSSWKITHPLRKVLHRSPTLHKSSRRAAKLVWWTLTGQIVKRLKARRAFLASDLAAEDIPVSAEVLNPPAPEPVAPIPESARSLEDDYALAVPFRFPLKSRTPKVAVILHLFHEETAGEFRSYLENIPFDFRLFISTPHEAGQIAIERTFAAWTRGPVDVRILPNRGRDIAPKLLGFRDVYDEYEYVLHLHSKKSTHDSVLFFWRQFLLEGLVGSPHVVESIFEVFERNPQIGIVASQHFEPVRHWINWGHNFELASSLAQRMGITLDPSKVLDFPSGSMFWARSAALKPLLDLDLSFDDFPEEAGQIDATLAHAIERLYFYVCEHAGYDWIKIARPELNSFTPAIFTALSAEDLDRFLSQFTLRLLASGGPAPRTTFPTPIQRPARSLLNEVQRRSLGLEITIDPALKVVVGIVTYNNTPETLETCIASARLSLDVAGLQTASRIHILDNGESSGESATEDDTIVRRPSIGNVGFGAGHNLLMRSAFEDGADFYLAINPDGALHPEAVTALVQIMNANFGRAIVEGMQFPFEHQKPYDPYTLDTPWVSGACMMLSRQVFEELGGFDETFFMYCEDVDLSWRARAAGIPLKLSPRALFLHAVTNRETSPNTLRMIFQSGVILARKWGSQDFESWLQTELEARGFALPDEQPSAVPQEWRRIADFTHHFSFAKPRW